MKVRPCARRPVSAPGEYPSQLVAKITGASYRQVDYWVRTGLVGPIADSGGPGWARFFTAPEVLMFRAMVTISAAIRGPEAVPGGHNGLVRFDQRFEGVLAQLETAYSEDPTLTGLVLVIDEHTATVTEREFYLTTGMAEAAVIVDMAACASVLPKEEPCSR